MKKLLLAIGVLAGLSGTAATATTYTYNIDYDFPILRLLGSGSSSFPTRAREGRGSVTGTVTLDDTFDTTNLLLSFNLITTNTSTGFSVTNSSEGNRMTYRSTDAGDTYSRTLPGTWGASSIHTIGNPDSGVACSVGLIAPSGQHQNRQYGISGSSLALHIDRNFKAGDAEMRILGVERYGRAPLCFSNGFADLGYEHTAPSITAFAAAGALAAPVPLPAGLTLIGGGLAALGLMKRRQRRARS